MIRYLSQCLIQTADRGGRNTSVSRHFEDLIAFETGSPDCDLAIKRDHILYALGWVGEPRIGCEVSAIHYA